jgi:hypothetical protein
MADVFVSYTREDQSRVAGIVDGLRQAGLSVSWDLDIPGGADWRRTLQEHLASAPCVIVLWSELSAGQPGTFVQDEAARAMKRGVLLPVRIDAVEEPLGFSHLQSMNLVGWAGDVDDPRFTGVVAAARAMIAGEPRPAPMPAPPIPRLKELLTWLARRVSEYPGDLLGLASGPKRFVAGRLVQRERWQTGLLFFALSFLLTFAIGLPFAGTSPLRELASDAAFATAYVVLFGLATFFAWRLLGAKAPIQEFLLIHFYLAGVLKLILTATFVVAMGVLRGGDPGLYRDVAAAAASGDFLGLASHVGELFTGHPALRVAMLVVSAGHGAMLAWVVAGWGAYRALAGSSRSRSLLAFVLYCLFCLPAWAVTTLMAAALSR